MYKVLILEDDAFTRANIETSVSSFGHKVSFSGDKPTLALRAADSIAPDVAILDLHLGAGATGLDVAQALRKKYPEIGIVILTSYSDPRLLLPSLPKLPTGGVYLVKKDIQSLSELKDAILASKDQRNDQLSLLESSPFRGISDSQIEILRLVADGLSNAEIAKERYITEKAVEAAISRIAKSLGVEMSPHANQRVRIAKIYFSSIGTNL
jgi:DNA-binding NarL/FixJ family response regulator